MKIYTLEREQSIHCPLVEIFRFFADASNLERLTPPWLRFRIVDPPSSIRQGTRINYSLRIHGFPVRWQSTITSWEPPRRFVDEQTRGPYRLWIHEHSFFEKDGGTLVRDHVRYAVFGGGLVNRFMVEPDLARIFDYRRKALMEIWEGTGLPPGIRGRSPSR